MGGGMTRADLEIVTDQVSQWAGRDCMKDDGGGLA
jgi:hypothetical protein